MKSKLGRPPGVCAIGLPGTFCCGGFGTGWPTAFVEVIVGVTLALETKFVGSPCGVAGATRCTVGTIVVLVLSPASLTAPPQTVKFFPSPSILPTMTSFFASMGIKGSPPRNAERKLETNAGRSWTLYDVVATTLGNSPPSSMYWLDASGWSESSRAVTKRGTITFSKTTEAAQAKKSRNILEESVNQSITRLHVVQRKARVFGPQERAEEPDAFAPQRSTNAVLQLCCGSCGLIAICNHD